MGIVPTISEGRFLARRFCAFIRVPETVKRNISLAPGYLTISHNGISSSFGQCQYFHFEWPVFPLPVLGCFEVFLISFGKSFGEPFLRLAQCYSECYTKVYASQTRMSTFRIASKLF